MYGLVSSYRIPRHERITTLEVYLKEITMKKVSARYLSYDVNTKNDRKALDAFIEQYSGEQITDSLYMFLVKEELAEFLDKIYSATRNGDRVYLIHNSEGGITHTKIRDRN